MQKISRHQERVWALQVLYSLDLKDKFNVDRAKIELHNVLKENELNNDQKYYFQELVEGVVKTREELDLVLDTNAIDWNVERMACLDRNILRIALFEMKNEIPEGVAINEAVELAKEFGDDKSSSFINGILAKSVEI